MEGEGEGEAKVWWAGGRWLGGATPAVVAPRQVGCQTTLCCARSSTLPACLQQLAELKADLAGADNADSLAADLCAFGEGEDSLCGGCPEETAGMHVSWHRSAHGSSACSSQSHHHMTVRVHATGQQAVLTEV